MEKLDQIIEEQERILRFAALDLDMIHSAVESAADSVRKLGRTAYIRAAVNGTVVCALCLPGSTKNNEEWARRKAALCERYWISSLHVVRNFQKSGKTLLECGMDEADFGFSGGSFPLLLENGICIGSLTVSGMEPEVDHQVACDALATILHVEIPSVL